MADKYWLAKNPNGEVTDAQVVALKSLSTLDLDEIDDLVAALPVAAEIDAAAATAVVGDANNTELLADVEVMRVTLNSLLAKLRTAKVIAA